MERPLPIEPEELLAHAHWMRSLAQSLVHDASSADDVVQESMAAALRRPPLGGPTLRAWLARVVRNVASNFKRGEQRLAERHRARGADEGSIDPSATIERLDTQRLIVDLVRELDEPARSTIVMCYFEGLTSVEVGRRMGVSDATVRWRLQKALDELRARLQRKCGSRDAWCALLVPFTHTFKIGPTTAAAAGATAGAMTMGAMSKVALAAVSLSIVGAGLWFALDREQPGVRSAEAAASATKQHEKLIEPVIPAVVEREVLAASSDPVPSSATSSSTSKVADPAVPGSIATLRVRFVDSAGRPWDGVTFRTGENSWGLAERDKAPISGGADGRVELSLSIPETNKDPNYQFIASRPGCATRALHATLVIGGVVDLGEVVLEREARILGSVHDAHGVGLAGVSVGILSKAQIGPEEGQMRRTGPWNLDRMILTTSNAGGSFELRGVPSGEWCLWGHRDDLAYGYSELFEVKSEAEKTGVDFEVPMWLATDTISGRVIDPEGKPAAQAMVSFEWSGSRSSGTVMGCAGADGAFEIILNTESSGELHAGDPEDGFASATIHNVAPGARGIVLQLADVSKQPVARLRVHGPTGEPVQGAKLMAAELQKHGGTRGRNLTASEPKPGQYEFPVPQVRFDLSAVADGYIEGKLKGLDPASLPADLELGLELTPLLTGRVSAAGKPLAKASIEALPAVRKGKSITINGFPCLMNSWKAVGSTSDEEGRFTLKLQGKDPVYVRCVADGFAPKVVGPIDIDSMSGPLDIELAEGGVIEGHVRSKDGAPVVGAIVGITCGDGHPLTMLSGREGGFRFEGLSAGAWLVMEAQEEVTESTTMQSGNKELQIDWSATVTAGRTTYFDLTLKR